MSPENQVQNLILNPVGDQTVAEMSRILDANPSCTSLKFGEGNLSAGFKYFAKALETNRTVTSLSMGYIDVGPNGAQHLEQALKVNNTLKSLEIWTPIFGSVKVKPLLKFLVSHPTLTKIYIDMDELDPTTVAEFYLGLLTQNPVLTSLILNLRTLDSNARKLIADALAQNTVLTELQFLNTNLSGDALAVFITALQVNKTLKQLDLSGSGLDQTSGKHLGTILAANSTLNTLKLHGNTFLGSEGVASIVTGLKTNTSLTTLDLSNTGLDDIAAETLSVYLGGNPALTSLDLSLHAFGSKGIESLVVGLGQNTNLRSLDLSGFTRDSSIALHLAKILKCNRSLRELNLSGNKLPASVMEAMADGLKSHPTLVSLDLSSGACNNEELWYLVPALKQNRKLREFTIKYSKITAEPLADVIRHHPSLTTLTVAHNAFRAAEIKLIMEAITANDTLRELSLESNAGRGVGVDDQVLEHISKAIVINHTLTTLLLKHAFIRNPAAMTGFIQALEKNRSLLKVEGIQYCIEEKNDALNQIQLLLNRNLANAKAIYTLLVAAWVTKKDQNLLGYLPRDIFKLILQSAIPQQAKTITFEAPKVPEQAPELAITLEDTTAQKKEDTKILPENSEDLSTLKDQSSTLLQNSIPLRYRDGKKRIRTGFFTHFHGERAQVLAEVLLEANKLDDFERILQHQRELYHGKTPKVSLPNYLNPSKKLRLERSLSWTVFGKPAKGIQGYHALLLQLEKFVKAEKVARAATPQHNLG